MATDGTTITCADLLTFNRTLFLTSFSAEVAHIKLYELRQGYIDFKMQQ